MNWFHYLPPRLLPCVQSLPTDVQKSITEIRLRLGSPFSVTASGKNLMPDRNGLPCTVHSALRSTREDIDEMLSRMTAGSRYAFEEQMACGFLTLQDGCRAGLAGEMTPHPHRANAYLFGNITSINLRVARFIPLFARELVDRLRETRAGALVISPPAGGKTTYLRSAAYLLACGTRPYRVGIADERNELAVADGLCDRITGCPKAVAIELLTRTMSPEFLICDELGTGEEAAVLAAQNTGVRLIASVHAGSLEQAFRRPCVRTLCMAGVFDTFAELTAGYQTRITEGMPTCV